MFSIDIPELPAVADGFLSGVNVIDGSGHQLFNETKYELPLDGFNKDVPAEGVEKDFDTELANEFARLAAVPDGSAQG